MAETRYAVVTGANKGIGFEIVKQLASKGIVVVLTARDEKRGLEAVHKLKESGLSEHVVFHKLDVTNSTSVASLADFVKTKFGKLDILVNNAGVLGVEPGTADPKDLVSQPGIPDWYLPTVETLESSTQGLEINYYGVKRVSEALIPLLKLSASPRIVNVSSLFGKLEFLSNEWARGVLGDAENLTEKRVEEVIHKYLKDLKEGTQAANGWTPKSAYIVSKASLNAYTRVLAKQYPKFYINSVHPGYVVTELNFNNGQITPAEGAASPVHVALLPDGGPSGRFYLQLEESAF